MDMATLLDQDPFGSHRALLLEPTTSYTRAVVGQLRGEMDHWRSVRSILTTNFDSWASQLPILYGSNSALQPAVPSDWYRTRFSLHGSAADDLWLGGCSWSPSVAHDVGLASLNYGSAAPDDFWPVDRCAPERVDQYPVYSDALFMALDRAREGLLRFVGGIIAALSLVLVLVLAALSRRINTTNLVLLLIAACRRFGHRDEPGHDDSLLARRYQSLPGRAPAV